MGNQKGFGIVEILMAFALLGGLTLSVMAMNQVALQSVQSAKSMGGWAMTESRVKMILETPNLCRTALQRAPHSKDDAQKSLPVFDPAAPLETRQSDLYAIQNPASQTPVLATQQSLDSKTINAIYLVRTSDPVQIAGNRYSTLAELVFSLQPNEGPNRSLGSVDRVVKIPMRVITTTNSGSQQVLDCSSGPATATVGTCPEGQLMAGIHPDGSIACTTLSAQHACTAIGGKVNSVTGRCKTGQQVLIQWDEVKACLSNEEVANPDFQGTFNDFIDLNRISNVDLKTAKSHSLRWNGGLYLLQAACSRWCRGGYTDEELIDPDTGKKVVSGDCGKRKGINVDFPPRFTSGSSIEYNGPKGEIACVCVM